LGIAGKNIFVPNGEIAALWKLHWEAPSTAGGFTNSRHLITIALGQA
jgi:hypothetical protein